jgi:hypothetical protein
MLLRYVSDTAPGWHGIKESTREIRAGLDERHGGNDKNIPAITSDQQS